MTPELRRFWLRALSTVCFLFLQPLAVTANESDTVTGEQKADAASPVTTSHAISLHGQPKYNNDFRHFGYANPDAPKGGTLKLALTGTFDSFNPWISKGNATGVVYLVYETLMVRSWDEPLSKYGVLVQKIERPVDNSWIAFNINPEARFHDGHPVTAEDVAWSFSALTEQGSPTQKSLYKEVERTEVTSPLRIVFHLKNPENRELPLVLGQLPVLPKHYWTSEGRSFDKADLTLPLGSGPYRISKFEAGRFITLERVDNYWAADHPVNRGRNNFDVIQYDYYRDNTVAREAFQAGSYDWRIESDPRYWINDQNTPQVKSGKIIAEQITNHNPQTQSLVFNTRRKPMEQLIFRQALSELFNFDQINSRLFHGELSRADSFFAGTDMAAPPLPGKLEKTLLEPFARQLPAGALTVPWHTPDIATAAEERSALSRVLKLLQDNGWQHRSNKLFAPGSDDPVELELLTSDPQIERTILAYKQLLERLGIQINLRTVDSSQYITRLRAHDYDLLIHSFHNTPSPGIEQAVFWGSASASQSGSKNYSGCSNPVVDDMIQGIGNARTRQELIGYVQAMDRVVRSNYYAHPLWYQKNWNLFYRNYLRHPAVSPLYVVDIMAWWHQPE
ncbi:extracellular solute-binding protein [Spongorhabdus nitratireducens]